MPAALPLPAFECLHRGLPALVLSAGAAGEPHSTYSWMVATGERTLRFVVDQGSVTSANLVRGGRGAVQVVGTRGLNLLIAGSARRLAERVAAAEPNALEMWELDIDAVKDQSWPGVTTSTLAYRWPAEQRVAMRRLEKALYAELRAAR